MEYKISEKLAETLLQYLATKPYAEVFQLVEALQKLEKIEKKK